MKSFSNGLSLPCSILVIIILMSACRGRETRENETSTPAAAVSLKRTENEKYILDKKESLVTWKGSMQFAADAMHIGYVYVSNGELTIEGGQLVGGSVEIDMNTIADKEYGSTNDLVNHLKSSDFFDVNKFPTSAFTITKVGPTKGADVYLTGNLTIKGITHPITFPVRLELTAGTIKANGKLTIDRTNWDVRYNSGKFYDNLFDETISDDIELQVKIVARKK